MGSETWASDRRSVLSGMAAAFGGLAGCSSVLSGGDGRMPAVSMLVAGSLNNAFENGLGPAVDTPVQVEAHGSAEVARLVASGRKDPDIVSVSDVSLFDSVLQPDWTAEFATNALVLAYDPGSDGGQRLAAAGTDSWYRPLLRGSVDLGRTDPDLDPLGYRTLFALELATDYYGTDANLREEVPGSGQVYPETQLISQFETGSVDAAVAYRSMAVERGYGYVELPPAVNLGDPAFVDDYATVEYELPAGTVVNGDLVSYGSTVRHRSPATVDAFDAQVDGEYLTEFGFTVPEDFPRYTGNVPETLAS